MFYEQEETWETEEGSQTNILSSSMQVRCILRISLCWIWLSKFFIDHDIWTYFYVIVALFRQDN